MALGVRRSLETLGHVVRRAEPGTGRGPFACRVTLFLASRPGVEPAAEELEERSGANV